MRDTFISALKTADVTIRARSLHDSQESSPSVGLVSGIWSAWDP